MTASNSPLAKATKMPSHFVFTYFGVKPARFANAFIRSTSKPTILLFLSTNSMGRNSALVPITTVPKVSGVAVTTFSTSFVTTFATSFVTTSVTLTSLVTTTFSGVGLAQPAKSIEAINKMETNIQTRDLRMTTLLLQLSEKTNNNKTAKSPHLLYIVHETGLTPFAENPSLRRQKSANGAKPSSPSTQRDQLSNTKHYEVCIHTPTHVEILCPT